MTVQNFTAQSLSLLPIHHLDMTLCWKESKTPNSDVNTPGIAVDKRDYPDNFLARLYEVQGELL